MKIAIIGFGLSGFSFLKTLIDNTKYSENFEIDIYEKRDEYPVGIPYEDDSSDKLLNVDADEMVYPESDKDDFKNWMDKKGKSLDDREKMAPRIYFGQYLKDKSKPYINRKEVNVINEEVIDLDVSFGKNKKEIYRLKTKNLEETYDAVFMGAGASFYQDPYNLSSYKNFIRNPYPLRDKLKDIRNDQRVAIIGTSASSTDVFRYLKQSKNLDNKINFFTGKDEYKIVDIPYLSDSQNISSIDSDWIKKERESNNSFISLENLIKTIKNDFKRQGQSLEYAYDRYSDHTLKLSREAINENDQSLAFTQDYFMDFVVYVADILNYMTKSDKEIFIEKYYDYLNFLSGKTPHQTMKWILDSYNNGSIDIILNTKKVEVNDNGTFTLTGDRIAEADVIINCTGIEKDLKKVADKLPLIKSLYDKNIIIADEDGKDISVTWPECNPISKRFGRLKNLFITGMLIDKTDIDNNDARRIQKTASRLAEIFLENL